MVSGKGPPPERPPRPHVNGPQGRTGPTRNMPFRRCSSDAIALSDDPAREIAWNRRLVVSTDEQAFEEAWERRRLALFDGTPRTYYADLARPLPPAAPPRMPDGHNHWTNWGRRHCATCRDVAQAQRPALEAQLLDTTPLEWVAEAERAFDREHAR